MKIVIVSDDVLKQELLSQPLSADLDIQWLGSGEKLNNDHPIDACIDLLFEDNADRKRWLKELHTSLVVVNAVLTPLSALKEDFVRINGWPGFLCRNIIEAASVSDGLKEKAETLFAKLGRKTEWVPDVPGFVSPRIIATIINEAFLVLEERVSVEEEIDTAMKLGTNYPFGPFEWGQKIGYGKVYSLLELLGNEQNRYKPSILMKGKILV